MGCVVLVSYLAWDLGVSELDFWDLLGCSLRLWFSRGWVCGFMLRFTSDLVLGKDSGFGFVRFLGSLCVF